MIEQPYALRRVEKRFCGQCPALEVELLLLVSVTFDIEFYWLGMNQ